MYDRLELRSIVLIVNSYQANGDRQPTRLLIIAPLVLAYLILDDL